MTTATRKTDQRHGEGRKRRRPRQDGHIPQQETADLGPRSSRLVGAPRDQAQSRRDGTVRHPRDQGVRRVDGHDTAVGQTPRRDYELAAALWETGWYEARILTSFVDEPERVTAAQMDRWARDFENWAICDTICFHLFDRTPHAWRKVEQWSTRRDGFVKRAAFALLASLALHDKRTADEPFVRSLPLIERAAADERNFVKKAVSWALRAAGRRNQALNTRAVEMARRLAESPEAAARWVGRDALRELTSPAVRRRLATPRRAAKA